MNKKQKKISIEIFTLVLLISSLFLLITSITYAIFQNLLEGTTSNIINTGTVSFTYTEGDFAGNGIQINDAYPISDTVGKTLTGEHNYFDFTVNGKTTIGDLNYEIVVVKEDTSTLSDDFIKIYLSSLNGSNEVTSDIVMNNGVVKTFGELESSTKQTGKIVYLGNIPNHTMNYQQSFRLRMWITDAVKDMEQIVGKSFSVKINVLGVQ